MGKHNIICIEDLVHDILTIGPHFKEANNFFSPFKLKAPLGGLKKKRNHYVVRLPTAGFSFLHLERLRSRPGVDSVSWPTGSGIEKRCIITLFLRGSVD